MVMMPPGGAPPPRLPGSPPPPPTGPGGDGMDPAFVAAIKLMMPAIQNVMKALGPEDIQGILSNGQGPRRPSPMGRGPAPGPVNGNRVPARPTPARGRAAPTAPRPPARRAAPRPRARPR